MFAWGARRLLESSDKGLLRDHTDVAISEPPVRHAGASGLGDRYAATDKSNQTGQSEAPSARSRRPGLAQRSKLKGGAQKCVGTENPFGARSRESR